MVKGSGVKKNAVSLENYVLQPAKALNGTHPSKKLQIPIGTLTLGDVGRGRVGSPQANHLMEQLHPEYAHQLAASFKRAKKLKEAVLVPNYPGLHLSGIPHQALHTSGLTSPKLKQRIDQHILKQGMEKGGLDRESKSPTSTILNKPLKTKGKPKKLSKNSMTSPLKYLETEDEPAPLTSQFKSVVDKYQELTRKRNQREAKFQLLQEKLLLEMATVVRESTLHGPHTDSVSRASENLLAAAMHSKKYSLNSSHIKEAVRGNGDFHQSDQNLTQNGVASSKRVLKPGLPKPRPPRPAEGNGMANSDMMKTVTSEMHQTHHKQGLSTVSSLGSKQPVDRYPPESRQSSSGASGKRSLLDIVNAAATLIQKNIRGFLCRRNLSRLFRSVLMSSEHKDLFNQSENDISSEDLDDQAERGDILKHHTLKNETQKSKHPHRSIQGPQKPNFKKDKPKLSHDPMNYDQGDSKYYYDVGVKQARQAAAQNGYADHNGSHEPEPSEHRLNGGGGSNTFSDSSSFNQRAESQTTPRERSMLEMRKTQKKDYRDFTDSKSKDKSQKVSHHFEGKVLVDEFHRAEKLLLSEIQQPESPSLSDSARERVKMRRTDQGSSFHKHKEHSDHKRIGKRTGHSEPTVVNKQVPTKPSEPDILIDFKYDKHPQKGKNGTPSSTSFDEQTEPLRGDLPMAKQSQMVNVATQMSKKSLPQVEKGVLTEPPEDSDFRRLGDILASISHQNKDTKEVQEGPSDSKARGQTSPTGPSKVLPQIKSNRRLYEGASAMDGESINPTSQQELKNGPHTMKPSQSRAQLDTFAKEQYMNWSQVDRLLSKMNSIQTKGGSREVNEVFKQLEEIANINKMSLKSKFQIDPTLSQIQTEALSAGTEKDLQASFAGQMLDSKRSGFPQSDASSKRNPQGAATYTFSGGDMKNGSSAAPNSVFQNADQLPSNILKKSMDSISGGFSNSPLNISYAGSQTQKPIRKNSKDSVQEVWPENPWIQVQESVESKLEPFKNSDQKRLAFGLRGFGRDELSLSESVIRSSVVERETNQFNDFGTAERLTAKDQLIKGSPKATGLYSRLSGPHDGLTLNTMQQARPGLINSPKTPIGTDDIIFESLITNQQRKKGREVPSRFEDEIEGAPLENAAPRLLQKTRSKKSIPRLVPLDELPESGRDELSISKCEEDGLPKPQFNANLMKTYADWKAGPHQVTVQSLEKSGCSKPLEGSEGSRDKQEKFNFAQKPNDTLGKNTLDKQAKIQAATVDNARSGPRLSPKQLGGSVPQSATPKVVPAAPFLPGSLTYWRSKPETQYIVNQSLDKKANPPQLQDSNRSNGKVLQEANVALQSILDDINSFMEIEEVFIDSGRRDRGESRVWNDLENSISAEHSQIKYNISQGSGSPILYPRNEVGQPVKKGTSSPSAGKPQQEGFSGHVNSFQGRTTGQTAKDISEHRNAVVNTITDKVLETVVTEMLEDPSYYSLVKAAKLPQSHDARLDPKESGKPAALEEGFLKIDEELLAYDDLPRSSAQSSKKRESQLTGELQSSKQNQPNSNGSIGEHLVDETSQPSAGGQKSQGNRNLEDLLDDLPDLDDLPAHDSESKKDQKKDEPKKVTEDKHDYSGDDEQSDAETVYGLRTNFNAVSEYLLILMKFLKDRQAELGLPGSKDSPDVVLKKAHLLELELKEYKNNDTKVVNVQIPPKTKKATAEARALCFKRNTEPGSFLQAQHFLVLEEEILSSYKDMNIMEDLVDMQRVYHRAIFDCFNEGLTESIFATLPTFEELLNRDHLKKNPKQKKDQPGQPTNAKKESWLEKAKDHVLECITILAGLIRDKEDSLMGTIKYMDDENIQQLREDRMYRMITAAVVSG